MSRHSILLTSTVFRVLPAHLEDFTKTSKATMGSYHEEGLLDGRVRSTPMADAFTMQIHFSSDVGESFRGRVQRLAKEISPFLETPVEITLHSDTMDDERDEYFYAGPGVEALKTQQHVARAYAILSLLPGFPKDGQGLQNAKDALLQWTQGVAAGAPEYKAPAKPVAALSAADLADTIKQMDEDWRAKGLPSMADHENGHTLDHHSDRSIAVFVLAGNVYGEPELLVVDVATVKDDEEIQHYQEARQRARDAGYDVGMKGGVFDENDPPARAVNRAMCVELPALEAEALATPAPR